MSKETSTPRRDTSVQRKVSLSRALNREDSGYNSVIGTPAGTPAVMNRKTSRVEQNLPLEGIPEGSYDHDQVILLDKLFVDSLLISCLGYCKFPVISKVLDEKTLCFAAYSSFVF